MKEKIYSVKNKKEYDLYFDSISSGLFDYAVFLCEDFKSAENFVSRAYIDVYKAILRENIKIAADNILFREVTKIIDNNSLQSKEKKEKSALFLFFSSEKTTSEISDILDVPVSVVTDYLIKAVKTAKIRRNILI